mmetsp:Transcript_46967/g.134036  ORF Transcript_46967/g.134036 Transcript_46967/m.134036 type:complete len:210 (+) Transcript_46967:330-959(+)
MASSTFLVCRALTAAWMPSTRSSVRPGGILVSGSTGRWPDNASLSMVLKPSVRARTSLSLVARCCIAFISAGLQSNCLATSTCISSSLSKTLHCFASCSRSLSSVMATFDACILARTVLEMEATSWQTWKNLVDSSRRMAMSLSRSSLLAGVPFSWQPALRRTRAIATTAAVAAVAAAATRTMVRDWSFILAELCGYPLHLTTVAKCRR